MSTTRATALLLGLSLLLGSGCTLFRGSYRFGWYSVGGVRYQVGRLPRPWAIDYTTGVDLLFTHPDGSQMYADNSCARNRPAPLRSLGGHLQSGFDGLEVHEEQTFPLDGREALQQDFSGRLDGVEMRVLATTVRKDGCVFDMTLVSRPEQLDAHRAAYGGLVEGFRAEVVDP